MGDLYEWSRLLVACLAERGSACGARAGEAATNLEQLPGSAALWPPDTVFQLPG